jgi:CheY-like chemotaxis protein
MNETAPMNAPCAAPPASALVVDDDEFACDVVQDMLSLTGIDDVHTARNGRVALQVLETLQTPPTVLICDVFMPDMDGIEFLEQLAQQKFSGGIIILSGVDAQMLNLSTQIALARGLNVLGSFIKPVTLEQLSTALGRPLIGQQVP